MAKRIVTDCDCCGAAEINPAGEFNVAEPRQPGEMDGGSESFALCVRCLVKVLVTRVVKTNTTASEFRREVKTAAPMKRG